MTESPSIDPYGYRRVLRNREARGLLLAQVASEFGDQIARVALALLVLQRTNSALYAALTLAVSYVPGVVAAALLGSLADRYPRRALMLAVDLGQILLIGGLALIAVEGTPFVLLLLVLLVSEVLTVPFASARAALYPDVLPDPEDFVAAQGLSRAVHLTTQVFGAVIGGAIVGLVGARTALALDALTFLVSYTVIRVSVLARPAADEPGTSPRRILRDLGDGISDLAGDPARRALVLLAWGSALFLVAPEAVALAYRPDLAPVVGGALLAAVPAGSAIGALLLPRVRLLTQVRLLLPMAAAACLPLFASSVDPPALVAAALWFVGGLLQAFMLTVFTLVTLLTPGERRGRVLGVAVSGFNAGTALSFALVGWLATLEPIGPARAVSLAGAFGLVLVAALRVGWPTRELEDAV